MALTLTGFVYDNAGNAISGATVQGYVSADAATSTAEASTTTDSNGKWAITTSTAARIPMDVLITYGSNKRWIKAGDKLNVTDMTVTGTLTVGEDAAGFDFALYSSDSAGDGLTWDASEEVLQITGKNGATSLDVLDGDVRIVDKLYFYDRGGEYLSSDGSTLTITGATTIGALSLTSMSSNWTNASRTVADMGIVTTIDINGGTIDSAAIGSTTPAAIAGTTGAFSGLITANGGITFADGDDIAFTGASTTNDITLVDSLADALSITRAGTDMVVFDSSTPRITFTPVTTFTGAITASSDLTVSGNLTVTGTTITVDTVTMNAANAVVFEGATADGYETTLTIEDPTADRTVVIPNVGGTLAVLAADSDTAITSTPAELNLLDGVSGLVQADLTKLAAIDATADEIDLLDGSAKSTSSITIDDADAFVVIDGNTTKQIPASDISAYVTAEGSMSSFQLEDDDGTEVTINNANEIKLIGSGITTNWTDTDNGTDGDPYDMTFTVDADQTGIESIYSTSLKMGRDSQNLIDFATTDDKIILRVANVDEVELVANVLQPTTNDGVALGTTSLGWSDLHLATAGVINWANGEMTITEGADVLTVAGGTFATAALTTSTIVASGIIKTNDSTPATSTTDGSLQTDGGLSVALDGIFGDDVTLITDSAVLNLGVGSDVSLTHDGTTGGTLSGTPIVVESLGASALANDTYTGLVLGFIAHEDMDVGEAVYIHTDDGEVGIADANALATMPAIGVVVGADASADDPVKILVQGIYNDSDGFDGVLTEGATMYLGEAVGTVTATIPDADGDFVQIMGIACGPRDVYINPSLDIIERD